MGLLDLEWLRSFAALHEAARYGGLEGDALAAYRREREDLERALLEAQQFALEPGQRPRRALRVAHALQVSIHSHDQTLHASTLNISAGGFAVLLPTPPQVAAEVNVSLSMPDGKPLPARARVVDVRQLREGSANSRVGLQFIEIDDADAERLAMLVFDAILGHLRD